MKLPRDISGLELARLLARFGYEITRQTGSHLRLTTKTFGEHHLTLPNHPSLRVGTLSSIISEIALHFKVPKDEVIQRLFLE